MSKQVRIRRGTSTQHATFTGADGEVTYDTTLKVLRLHDGATPGGKVLRDALLLNNPALAGIGLQTLQSGALNITGVDSSNVSLYISGDVQFTGSFATFGESLLYRPRYPMFALTYAATVDLNFSDPVKGASVTVDLTGNITFTTSNLDIGRTKLVRIRSDASIRTLTFPAWTFLGAGAPANIAASKLAILRLTSFATSDVNVVAEYSVQP